MEYNTSVISKNQYIEVSGSITGENLLHNEWLLVVSVQARELAVVGVLESNQKVSFPVTLFGGFLPGSRYIWSSMFYYADENGDYTYGGKTWTGDYSDMGSFTAEYPRYNLGKSAYSLDYDDQKKPYTKIRFTFGDGLEPYEYGTDEGKTLEIYNPWINYPDARAELDGSKGENANYEYPYADTVAQDILSRIGNYTYQPFDADGAFLPSEAELGDGVIVDGIYGAVVSQDITFDGLGNSNISAPNGDDTDNEFGGYVPSAENAMTERLNRLTTEFIVQNGYIKSAIFTPDEWSQFEQTHNSLSTVVGNKITNAKTEIKQDINSITLSVTAETDTHGNYTGDTTMKLTGTGINITARNLEFAVDNTRIAGKLTASQIDATNLHVSAANVDGDLRAGALYGGTVVLYDTEYDQGDYVDTPRGSFDLTGTEVGIGVAVNSLTGLKLNAVTNVSVVAGSGGELTLRDSHLIFSSTGIRLSTHCFGNKFPTDADYGELYFQLVT